MQNKIYFKFTSFALMIALGMGVFNISSTNAFYNDTESSAGNAFQAAMLDFILTNNNLNKIIGPEALGEVSHASVAMPESGSLAMQYILSASTTNDFSGLCGKLIVEAKQNGITKYSGPLSGLLGATTTDFGTWEFRFDMPVTASVAHGDICSTDAVFSAWRADITDPINSGWHDEETLNISFTARMVVLNEIYARPASGAVAPKNREFVELYNNGSTPVDVLGWQIGEMTGTGSETKHLVVASGASASQMQPFSGGTIIPAGGFLVLVFGTEGAEYFNNTGDTVKLYQNSVLLDSHTYPSIAAGKSVVRFPDGIGFWVDPEPTPGASNTVSFDDLRAAGFDDLMIAQVIELALIKNATILTAMQSAETLTENTATSTASTTPEIFEETGASETEVLIEADNSEGESLPPFKEEEIVVAENATTTPSIDPGQAESTLDDPVATTTLEIITEAASTTPEITPPDPLLQQEGGSGTPSPDQGEGLGGVLEPAIIPPEPEEILEVVSEIVVEPAPISE